MNKKIDLPSLTGGQRLALAGAIGLALALATYGAVGSYTTISTKAAELGVPLPHLVPIGIDGGLVGVIVLDLVLSWTGHSVGWLRQLTRLLTFGTVAANISAGWPHPIAIGLHAAAPLMLLVMVEAGRAVLLRRAGLASGIARDRIPIGRWILSPWRTWLLWRRMILWQISSYPTALDLDARLHRARHQLITHFGHRWQHTAPSEVVWMLTTAPFAEEACAQVEALLKHHTPHNVATTVPQAEQLSDPDHAHDDTNEPSDQLERPSGSTNSTGPNEAAQPPPTHSANTYTSEQPEHENSQQPCAPWTKPPSRSEQLPSPDTAELSLGLRPTQTTSSRESACQLCRVTPGHGSGYRGDVQVATWLKHEPPAGEVEMTAASRGSATHFRPRASLNKETARAESALEPASARARSSNALVSQP